MLQSLHSAGIAHSDQSFQKQINEPQLFTSLLRPPQRPVSHRRERFCVPIVADVSRRHFWEQYDHAVQFDHADRSDHLDQLDPSDHLDHIDAVLGLWQWRRFFGGSRLLYKIWDPKLFCTKVPRFRKNGVYSDTYGIPRMGSYDFENLSRLAPFPGWLESIC